MTAGRLLTRLQNGESEQVARTDCAHLLWSQRRGRGAMLFNYCPYRAGKGVCISLVISERVRFRVHKSPNVAPNAFPAPSCAEIDVQNPQKRILLLAKSWFSSHRHLRCSVCPSCTKCWKTTMTSGKKLSLSTLQDARGIALAILM